MLGKLAAILLFTFVSGLATAAITGTKLTANLAGPNAETGGLSGFDLWIVSDFDPLWSGGVTLAYDPTVLDFDSFRFDVSGAIGAPIENSTLCVAPLLGCVSGIIFESPAGQLPYQTQVPGGVKIGTFLFHHLGGESQLLLGEDPAAAFFNGSNPRGVLDFDEVNLSGASIVPLPLAGWLMLSGLGMLGALGFRKPG